MSERRFASRLAWFVGLWIASVTVLGIVAWLLRLWIGGGASH